MNLERIDPPLPKVTGEFKTTKDGQTILLQLALNGFRWYMESRDNTRAAQIRMETIDRRLELAEKQIAIEKEFPAVASVMTPTMQSNIARPSAPQSKASVLTNEETLAYQNKEIGKELWMIEKHMAQKGRIPDKNGELKVCDCIHKHVNVGALAMETIPIAERAGQPSEPYQKIADWITKIEPLVTVDAIEADDSHLPMLAGEASALRKELALSYNR